ncbi:kinesin-like protein KIFC3 isoform X1 [Callorhinchus milii]|uniref:kinesin-like protein KIFC3 isoform X1 n=1 Tax=Callorhinchus milii TaxID=7868 RepID=UPI001C3F7619|nr:kinesin-like protein KIFC3 isoform X1 [Callorhinchus milii]XP_042196126.1 kinesin-like protein KIFC3 isoform X1 [Callorhinchus milii]
MSKVDQHRPLHSAASDLSQVRGGRTDGKELLRPHDQLLTVKGSQQSLQEEPGQHEVPLQDDETGYKLPAPVLHKNNSHKLTFIRSLQDVVQEAQLRTENTGSKVPPPSSPAGRSLSAVRNLIDMINALQEDKVRLQEELSTRESKCQVRSGAPQCEIGDLEGKLTDQTQKLSTLCSELGTTDLEKHLEILVVENDRLKQDLNGSQLQLRHLRRSLSGCSKCDHVEENSQLRERLSRAQVELKKTTEHLSELELEVQRKTEHVSQFEQHLQDVLQGKAEMEEGLNKRIRDYQLTLARQSTPPVKYITKTVQVESAKTKQALEEAQGRNQYLQEQVAVQRQVIHEREQQLQESWHNTAKLQAQIMIYEAELERTRGEMLEELQSMEEEKNCAIEEAFLRAQSEMKAVHENLNGVRMNLLSVQPALKSLTNDYNCLKHQVRDFPCLLQDAICQTKEEIFQMVEEVKEVNRDLLHKYKREMQLRKKCHNELVRLRGNIRVFCRVRPITREDGDGPETRGVVSFDSDDDGVLYVSYRGKTSVFELDKVFPPHALQNDVFQDVQALITSCIDGYNVCIFAYGQTGSGKTYTMEGTPKNPGINQRALGLLFSEVAERSEDWDLTITVSMVEIYNETLRDLLGPDPQKMQDLITRNLLSKDLNEKLEIKLNPDGSGQLYVPGLTEIRVRSVEDINRVFELGRLNRATDCTNVNERSSRSHALLIISIAGTNTTSGVKRTGKLNLVDLAGSERVGKSGAEGHRLREAQNINKSLSALGDVIYALRSKQSYIPFRNSKLTYLLQDSLSGDSKTLMMVQVSPIERSVSETVCSLKFAQRVRSVELGAMGRRTENHYSPSRPDSELEPPPVMVQPGRLSYSQPGFTVGRSSLSGRRKLPATAGKGCSCARGRSIRNVDTQIQRLMLCVLTSGTGEMLGSWPSVNRCSQEEMGIRGKMKEGKLNRRFHSQSVFQTICFVKTKRRLKLVKLPGFAQKRLKADVSQC